MNLSVSSTQFSLTKRAIRFILSPKRFIFLVICSFVFTVFAFQKLDLRQSYATTGINRTINFQGKVVNSNGTNVADGQYAFVFKLYDAASGGSNSWTETQNNVQVTAGIFRVSLGSVTTFASAGVDFNTDNLYLGINFNSDGEMTPRVRFAAVPYAINAETVSGLTVTSTTGTFTLAASKTFTVNNTLGLSGTDGTTFTFPASSDTVVTLTATQELTNKTIGSTGLAFSGATTDISTVSNEDFTITPNGTGNINLTGDFNSQVLVGATGATTEFPLLVRNGIGSNAALAVDNLNNGDIFTASSAGTPKLTISSTGTITSAGYTNNGGILYTSTTGLITQTAGGSETNCLTFTGGAPAWGSCSTGAGSNWVLSTANGTLSPINNTLDLLYGGVSTQAASFSILGVAASTNPSASVSAQQGGNATKGIYLSGDGSLQSVRNNTLTLGGNTTGDIQFKPGNISTPALYVGTSGNIGMGTATPTEILHLYKTTGNYTTLRFDSATTQGYLFSYDGDNTVNIGANSSSPLNLRTSNAARATILASGEFGIGTTTPISQLHVTRALSLGATGKAVAIFDQIENQDIFTASSAGITKFTLDLNGSVKLAASQTIDTLTNGTLGIGTTTATTLTLGRASNGITLPGFDCSGNGNGGKLTTTSGGVLTCSDDANSGGPGGSSNWVLSTSNKTLSPINNTVDFLWGSTSSSSAVFKLAGITSAGTTAVASISANSTFAGLLIDQNGTGDFLTASASGLTKFTVTKAGGINASAGITVDTQGSIDIHKSTSGNNLTSTDFQRTANSTNATLTNLNNTKNALELSVGTVPNSGTGTITTGSQPAVPLALGQGAMSILRQNGTYLLIRGGNTTTMYIYDSKSGQIYASPQVLNAAAEEGAIALPRSDGRYRVVHGNAVTTTSLVDPNGVVAVGASVAIGTAPTVDSTVAYRRQNGRYFIAIGGTTASSVYNPSPTTETFSAGPTLTTTGLGAQILPRPDGSALIINGGSTATTQLYNPNNGTITNGAPIGSVSSGPALPTNCEINGAGSVAIQLPNWRYVILSKANVSVIYDAAANTMGPCQAVGPGTALGQGAHAIRYQDRKILIMVGGNSTASYIYNPTLNTYTTHGTNLTAIGIGAHTVMNYDGTFQVFVGNATTTNKIDAGLNMSGSYVSEDFNTASLNPSSSLLWTIGAENIFVGSSSATTDTPQSNVEFFVKTATSQGGLSSAIDKPIQRSGDLVNASSSDTWARVTVRFRRPIPQNPIDERFTYFANGPLLIKDFASPTLFDYTLDNSSVLTRNADNFANSALSGAPYEASASALTRVQNLPDRLTLPVGQVPGDAMVSTTGFYQGLIGPHPTTLVNTGEGTVVMQLPDGQVGVIATASASVNFSIYDPASSTFSLQSGGGDVPTTYPGWGSYALKLPDGRFLIVFGEDAGGTGRTTTNIYDPRAASGSRFAAGPALSANSGRGGFPIKNTDGTYTLVHGGAAATTTLFNPYKDLQQGTTALAAGPTSSSNITCGAWAVPMAGGNQGLYRVFIGVGQFTTGVQTSMVYDANKKLFQAAANTGVAFGCGSYVFQRQDGAWMVVAGAAGTNGAPAATLTVYNPYTNSFAAGTAMTNAAGRGSVAIPRADGTWLITRGQTQTIDMAANTANASSIWSPYGGSQVLGYSGGLAVGAGPQLVSPQGAGAVAFQRPDGKWVMINGGMAGNNNVSLIDTGYFADGQYLSGQMYVPQLSTSSVMTWKQNADKHLNIEVRTAADKDSLLTADYKSVYPSDGNLGAAATDKWLQVQINFSRDFPTYSDVNQDVWRSNGALAWRTIAQPTLFEYKITNDADLLKLQSGGQTVFRVNESGNIYAGQQGGFFTSGADLAENYSSVETLLPGEVVQIDSSQGDHNVKKTTGQYQKDALGVVSTKPGFVAGAYTEDSHPIALVGRVPVKVTNENGPVHAGDYLTSSSIPGYAMKATVGGRVLGKALEDFNEEYATECPKINLGSLPDTKCGEVMLFANLVDYNGQSVDIAMAEQGFAIDEASLPNIAGLNFELGSDDRRQQEILAFLKTQKNNNQGIFTDSIAATQEVISPKIITDLLVAKKIKAESIEGLEILTNKIDLLTQSASGSAVSQFSSQMSKAAANLEELTSSMKALSTRLEKMEALNLLSMSQFASGSGAVSIADNLVVFGTTTISEVSVMDSITVGNNLTIGNGAINALQDLEIQPLKQGNISFLGNAITFMANGEAVFRENVSFEKNVAVKGIFSAQSVQSSQLLLAQGKVKVLSDTEVESTAAAGLITLKKNTDHIKVLNKLVKDTSLIFITPKTQSSHQLYLLEQKQEDPEKEIDGSFTVGIEVNAEKNVEFNYLIVN